jgi:GntR family transcriptional regulator
MLDRTSPMPLYHQLKERLVERIASGAWPPESRLPSERELCELFGISRITVRQALDQLVAEGRLVRSHGRGTFVALLPLKKQLLALVGFTEDMVSRRQRPGARVLRFEAVPPPPPVARELQTAPGQLVVVLKRLRLSDGAPMAVETVHAPQQLFPGLLEQDLENRSFYELLRRRYGVRPARASQSWQAVACPRADARLLGVRTGSPVLQIRRTTYDGGGRPFEYLESFFRGDRYIYYAELRDGASEGGAPHALAASMEGS